jgi:Domain of unknown function (DU1801)
MFWLEKLDLVECTSGGTRRIANNGQIAMARKPQSASVPEFLAQLAPDRRREVERVRAEIRPQLPAGYEEAISKNMLVYQVPLDKYSDTYNGHPLWYVALASEKSHLSLHLMPVYGNGALAGRLVDGFKAAGKKLDMGKACVRFQTASDLALDAIGEIVASIPMDRWIKVARDARRR